jgi:hypothetical protein
MGTRRVFPVVDEAKPTLHGGDRAQIGATNHMSLNVTSALRRFAPRRFVVADRSMEPALVAGQGVIGMPTRRARVGQLRTFEHPERRGFWLVKRVTAADGSSMIVESDNRDIPTEDSRSFGPIDVTGSYRIVVRIPRRWM